MTSADVRDATLSPLDAATRSLVRSAAALSSGTDDVVRAELQRASTVTPHEWIEEVILQTYLFAGFPRALNGMREWRRIVGGPRTSGTPEAVGDDIRARGARTCELVYGNMYEKLRGNVRNLHPLLDEWMILEGYGKVLSRPQLDLRRRELCIVAACVATGQDRQLQSHLHGARNVGVAKELITAVLAALADLISAAAFSRATRLWDRIQHDVH